MKKRILLGVAVLLLATPVLAQVGTPGYTIPDAAKTFTTVQTFRDTALKLTDNTTPTKIGYFELSGLTAGTNTFYLNSGAAGSFSLLTSALTTNAPDVVNSVWGVSSGLRFEGATADGNETTLTVTDPTGTRTITLPNASGTVQLANKGEDAAFNYYTLISGGITLSGTTTASPASTITVTVVDTTPSITDGDVQVCGYTTTGNQTDLIKTCETIDFATGGAVHATTATFIAVTNIKASSFATLGGSGDETIAAKWTTGDVEIFAAGNLANSAASDFTSIGIPAGKVYEPLCLDLQGCALGFGAETQSGWEVTVIGRDGTQNITFTDAAPLNVAASSAFTMGAGDTIKLMYSLANTEWVEISRSNN